jgi:hypothetical protein
LSKHSNPGVTNQMADATSCPAIAPGSALDTSVQTTTNITIGQYADYIPQQTLDDLAEIAANPVIYSSGDLVRVIRAQLAKEDTQRRSLSPAEAATYLTGLGGLQVIRGTSEYLGDTLMDERSAAEEVAYWHTRWLVAVAEVGTLFDLWRQAQEIRESHTKEAGGNGN